MAKSSLSLVCVCLLLPLLVLLLLSTTAAGDDIISAESTDDKVEDDLADPLLTSGIDSAADNDYEKRRREFVGKRNSYVYETGAQEKRLRDFVGKRDIDFQTDVQKRLRDFVGKRDYFLKENSEKRVRDFIGKRSYQTDADELEYVGFDKRPRQFVGKRPRQFVGKRIQLMSVGKRPRQFVGKRPRQFVGKRYSDPEATSEDQSTLDFAFEGLNTLPHKRLRDFVGKRAYDDTEKRLLAKRLREFIGKRDSHLASDAFQSQPWVYEALMAKTYPGFGFSSYARKLEDEDIPSLRVEDAESFPLDGDVLDIEDTDVEPFPEDYAEEKHKRLRDFVGKRFSHPIAKRIREFVGKRSVADYPGYNDLSMSSLPSLVEVPQVPPVRSVNFSEITGVTQFKDMNDKRRREFVGKRFEPSVQNKIGDETVVTGDAAPAKRLRDFVGRK